jgi:acyl carrier protein
LANLRIGLPSSPSAASAEQLPGEQSLREAIESSPPDARRETVENYLRDEIGRVLRMAPSRLDAHQSLNQLGIDSLMAVELRNHVQARLGVMIPLARLLQDPTIAQLAAVVLDQFGVAPSPSPPSPAPPSPSPLSQAPASPVLASPSADVPDIAPTQEAATALAGSSVLSTEHTVEAMLDGVRNLSDEEVDALLRQMLSEEQQQA